MVYAKSSNDYRLRLAPVEREIIEYFMYNKQYEDIVLNKLMYKCNDTTGVALKVLNQVHFH